VAKERAARRAQREAEAAARAAERAKEVARAARQRQRRERARTLLPGRKSRPDSVLAERRRAENLIVFGLFALVQLVGWVWLQSVRASLGLLVLSAFVLPVVLTLAFDRRGRS
jgi:Flp pilus assembly protein TadB